jgi:hypothetical protein
MCGHLDGTVAGGNFGMNWGKPGFQKLASAGALVERLKLALLVMPPMEGVGPQRPSMPG